MQFTRKRKLIITLSLLGILAGLGYVLLPPTRLSKSSVIWTRGSSQPVDMKTFRVVLFPRSVEGTPVPDSRTERAILVNLAEKSQEEIEVFAGPDSSMKVSSDSYTALPPTENTEAYLRRLNEAINSWQHETAWKSISFESSKANRQSILATLVVYTKRGDAYKYKYGVDLDGIVTPYEAILRRR